MAVPAFLVAYRAKRKAAAIRLLGGSCEVCGTVEDLQFDHIRTDSKINDIATMIRSESWGAIASELTKCQLLCREHHQVKSGMEKRVNSHGRFNMYRRGCRCEPCVLKYRETCRKSKKAYLERRRVANSIGKNPPS